MIDLALIFEGNVGESFSQDEIKRICEEGKERYDKNIPPGYKDKNKNEIRIYNGLEFESKYGDLILWKQVIHKAKEENKKVIIFVTEDYKEDWWYEISGRKIGARAELKNELWREAQADLILMNTNTFLRETSENSEEYDLIETTNRKVENDPNIKKNSEWLFEGPDGQKYFVFNFKDENNVMTDNDFYIYSLQKLLSDTKELKLLLETFILEMEDNINITKSLFKNLFNEINWLNEKTNILESSIYKTIKIGNEADFLSTFYYRHLKEYNTLLDEYKKIVDPINSL